MNMFRRTVAIGLAAVRDRSSRTKEVRDDLGFSNFSLAKNEFEDLYEFFSLGLGVDRASLDFDPSVMDDIHAKTDAMMIRHAQWTQDRVGDTHEQMATSLLQLIGELRYGIRCMKEK